MGKDELLNDQIIKSPENKILFRIMNKNRTIQRINVSNYNM